MIHTSQKNCLHSTIHGSRFTVYEKNGLWFTKKLHKILGLLLVSGILFTVHCSLFTQLARAGNFCPCKADIYLLLPAGKLPPEKFFDFRFLDGISVRVRWQDVEKTPGSYDWSYLDQVFKLARQYKKKVSLRLLGGYFAPEWIYKRQVPSFIVDLKTPKTELARKFLASHGHSLRLPAVWSIPYLRLWQNFVQAVGERYSQRPELTLVHLSGPGFFSAELILARNQDELELLKKNGFDEQKLLRVWQQLFLLFQRNFGDRVYALNVHYVIKGQIGLTKKIIVRAYKVFGPSLAIQGNWLDFDYVAKEQKRRDLLSLFKKAQKRGITIGFQTVGPILKQCGSKGLDRKRSLRYLQRTLKVGCRLSARYFELYPQDLRFFKVAKKW